MNEVPDENDLVYDTYGVDIFGLLRYLYEHILGLDWDALVSLVSQIWNIYSIIAILLSLLFFIGFIYAKIRQNEMHHILHEQIHEEEHKWAERYESHGHSGGRWTEIQKHLHDDNPNSWKIAIIEADIYLEEILNEAGYPGATLGEKLKSANTASFTTIQDAWEAHKVRNEVAHIGGDFILTKKVAQETLLQYERVFREFGVI
jgi:hypothetical protein